MPPVVFGRPESRDNSDQRWWYIPINIEKPDSKLIALFTKMEIARCHAEVIFRQWHIDRFVMRWESENLNGVESVTLEYHPTQYRPLIRTIPVVVRRSEPGPCFKSIVFDRGETRVTDFNFIHHGIKTEDNLLQNGTGYSFVLRLWSPEYPRWSVSREYALIVPYDEEDNNEFVLSILRN